MHKRVVATAIMIAGLFAAAPVLAQAGPAGESSDSSGVLYPPKDADFSARNPYPDAAEIERLWKRGTKKLPQLRSHDKPGSIVTSARSLKKIQTQRFHAAPRLRQSVITFGPPIAPYLVESAGEWQSVTALRAELFHLEDWRTGPRIGVYWDRFNDTEVHFAAMLASVGQFARAEHFGRQVFHRLAARRGLKAAPTLHSIRFLSKLYTELGRPERIYYRSFLRAP